MWSVWCVAFVVRSMVPMVCGICSKLLIGFDFGLGCSSKRFG